MALCATRHQRTKPSRTPSSRNFGAAAQVDSNPKCAHRLDSPLMISASMGLLVTAVLTLGSVQDGGALRDVTPAHQAESPASKTLVARAHLTPAL